MQRQRERSTNTNDNDKERLQQLKQVEMFERDAIPLC